MILNIYHLINKKHQIIQCKIILKFYIANKQNQQNIEIYVFRSREMIKIL